VCGNLLSSSRPRWAPATSVDGELCCQFESKLDRCADAAGVVLRQIIVRAMAREPEQPLRVGQGLEAGSAGLCRTNVWKLNRCAYAEGDIIVRQDETGHHDFF